MSRVYREEFALEFAKLMGGGGGGTGAGGGGGGGGEDQSSQPARGTGALLGTLGAGAV